MHNETYAVMEVSPKYIKFAVGKYKKTGLKVVFKEREKASNSWLTQNNEIIDTNIVAHKLMKMLNRYESIFKEKIKRIAVIYPTGTLQIKDSSTNVFIDSPDKIVRSEHINRLHRDSKKVIFDDRQVITNIKPYEYKINNTQSFAKPPLNARANVVSMNAKIYTAEKNVVDSFEKVLKTIGVEKLTFASNLYAIAKQCSDAISFRETFVLINWEWDAIEIGFFSRETLVKKEMITFGIKNIVENLALKMSAKVDIANKYVFKLLNFSSTTLDNAVVYRKYVTSERKTYELKSIDIKNMLLEELFEVIDKTDILIDREMRNVRNFKVYHTGKITEIAGFEKILLRSNYKNISETYFSLVTGASEIWTTSLCGMIKHSRSINKNGKEIITSTEIYQLPERNAVNQVKQNPQNMHFANAQQNWQLPPNSYVVNPNNNFQQNHHMEKKWNGQQNYQYNEKFSKNGIINKQSNKQ